MAEEEKTSNDGYTEDEMKGLIGSVLDSKLEERGLTKEALSKLDVLGSLEDLFKRNKSEPVDKESLLGDIGKLIDDKLKGIGSNGGSKTREPKIRIFS